MKISFHGAARTVTGSKHLLHMDTGRKLLLDCGMFQGLGKDTMELNRNWGFDPAAISYVVVSHAHIDHIGLLPKLVKDGFSGPVYCTQQTEDMARILLADSARIQEADVQYVNKQRARQGRPAEVPLYTEEDAEMVFKLFVTVPYNKPYKIDDDIELLYTECGHIVGSAVINLTIRENNKLYRVAFSGDIGRYNDLILRSPGEFPQADFIIVESTYGNKLHDAMHPATDALLDCIKRTCEVRKGKVIIPAFSVGRTQEVLYLLNRLDTERRLPKLNYYVDSPMSIRATEAVKQHPECFNDEVQWLLKKDNDVFSFPGLQYIESAEESIKLNSSKEPCVIISASGMAEAGRVKHHIAHNIEDPNSTILIVGYCESRSLGGKLRNGEKSVKIFGDRYDVLAGVEVMDSLSAHGDYQDLIHWLSCQDPEKVSKLFLVHGEYEVQLEFRERLLNKGFAHIEIPSLHQESDLG